jgi:type IV secretion system protein VirB1
MTLQALAFTTLMARCAPNVAPSTMAAIVRVESGGDPLAIGDNTTRRSYYPRDRATAEALARRLLNAGHLLDLGIAQIDSINFDGFGVNVHAMFDPCINLSVGSRILTADYVFAAQRYGDGQVALRHAIGMYNTGRLDAGARYVMRVLAVAGIREDYASNPHSAVQRRVVRLPGLVRAAVALRQSRITHNRTITPWRSPILVTVVPASHVKLF